MSYSNSIETSFDLVYEEKTELDSFKSVYTSVWKCDHLPSVLSDLEFTIVHVVKWAQHNGETFRDFGRFDGDFSKVMRAAIAGHDKHVKELAEGK